MDRILIAVLLLSISTAYEVEERSSRRHNDGYSHEDRHELMRHGNNHRSSLNNIPRGVVPTVFTPMHHDGSIDLDALHPYADYLVHNGIKAVLVGGTTGEHMSLDVHDRMKQINEWVKIGREKGLHIMAQVGAQPFDDVMTLTRYCVKVGVDSIITLPELYFKPRTVADLVFFVGLVAKEAPHLPVFYYHNPNYTAVDIWQPAFATEASKHIPNFKGIKFSDPDLEEADQTNRALRHDQEFYLAPEREFAPGAVIGIRSLITPILNIFPKLSQAILDAVARGDLKEARHLQLKMSLADDAIEGEGHIDAMKATMEMVTGLKMGPPHLPLRPISHAAWKRIETKLKKLDLL